jgi:hypothetical protein
MAQLHELLAAEKTATNTRDQLTKDTENKFAKGENYFTGFTKTLKMLGDATSNDAIEAAARQDKALPTTVVATLDYYLKQWSRTEDVLFQKNLTNTTALADLEFRGNVIATGVPVDELMGLETRLSDLRKLATQIPTLDASREWESDASAAQAGTWKSVNPQITTKTEKKVTPVVLYPHSDKHPAQIEKVTEDVPVGTFTLSVISGATTAIQKANVLSVLDDLIIEVKKARTRANSVDVQVVQIGKTITDLLMGALTAAPVNNAA